MKIPFNSSLEEIVQLNFAGTEEKISEQKRAEKTFLD
jgi:hypothetical protein